MSKRIVAIDPGDKESGVVVFEDRKILFKGIINNHMIIRELNDFIRDHMYGKGDLVVAIEMIASYGMPVGKEVFETCVWIGRMYEMLSHYTTDIHLIYRRTIKLYICGSLQAKDANIRQSLIDRYGTPGTKKNPNPVYNDAEAKMAGDLWSALAIATYVAENHEKNLVESLVL